MENIQVLIPEMILALLGLLILIAELLVPEEHADVLYVAGIVASGVTLLAAGLLPRLGSVGFGIGTLWSFDPLALFFKNIVLLASVLTLMLTLDYSRRSRRHAGTYTALVLWSTVGMMLLASSLDLVLLFLALELVSLSTFVLTGFERRLSPSSEGAIKYFLIGSLSSAITVYGISLFYGATGTTHLVNAAASTSPLFLLSLMLVTVGLGFKASLAPFHFWVPDAYEAAPTPITTFMSVAPKVATLAAILRVFTALVPHATVSMTTLLIALAMLTMSVGNLTALFQDNVKRLLAYSSVAQAGYILIGIVAGDALGQQGVLLYSLVYLFMNFGAFAVAMLVAENEGSYDIRAYSGLAQRNFGLALLMSIFLLSLAGIPPLAGFIGKFYLFSSAIKGGFYGLAIVGVLNSVISVYYYLRIAYFMFFAAPENTAPMRAGFYFSGGIVLTSIVVVAIGVYPQPILTAIENSIRMLP